MKKKNFSLIVLAALFILNIFAWIAVFDLKENKFLKVIFFDVGQGDASFIETPQRHQILIDGGPSSVILEKLGENLPFWDRTIDLLILTHPESDHLTGLLEVLKKYKVENILWTGIVRDTPEYKEWLNLIEKEGAKIKIAQAGQKIIASEATFYILNPSENLEGKIIKDSNDTSIVSKLVFGKNSFLFTGDIYNSVEKEFVSGGIDLKSDILKVSHHGSKNSSLPEFLIKCKPEYSVISCGMNNTFGHPSQITLNKLNFLQSKILRTDIDGAIIF